MKPIYSVRELARLLGTSADRLRQLAREIDDSKYGHYRYWAELNQRTGKIRQFRVPNAELMELQRRIKNRILVGMDLSAIAHGGISGRSPQTNARQHLAQPWVINMDVREFFPRVRHYVIRDFLRREHGFGREVAHILTRLMTVDAQLPQGAPTSTAIANVLLTDCLDRRLSGTAGRSGCSATRFIDDLAFSGNDPREFVNVAARALSAKRLKIWRPNAKYQTKPKFTIIPRHRRQEVTGLVVNSRTGPSISRTRRSAIKAALFEAKHLADAEDRTQAANSIRGRIAHLRTCNPGAARRMQQYLERLLDC
jgi:RNA-directed DNA polymerase